MSSTPIPPSRWKRRAWRVARFVAVVYIGVCVVACSLQDYMLFPGRGTQGQPHAIVREPTEGKYELISLTTSAGDKTFALFGAALDESGQRRADASTCPTVLLFYGNAMCLADCFGLLRDFRMLGVNVMIPDYVGYGMSSGKASETSLYQTADAAWDHLQARSDVDGKKIIAAGWSLGAAVAIDLASGKPVIGVMTFSAFSSVKDVARSLLPWFPASILGNRFDNTSKIARLTCPIFIAHGEHDTIIPNKMSKTLSQAATSSPRVERIDIDSDHNDLFDARQAIFDRVKKFIDSLR